MTKRQMLVSWMLLFSVGCSSGDGDSDESSPTPGAIASPEPTDPPGATVSPTPTTPPSPTPADGDGDGHHEGVDCNDSNAQVYPGAAEQCDEQDNDCDGEIDEDAGSIWYADGDHDGWGGTDTAFRSCHVPPDSSSQEGDCDDDDPAVNPAAEEVCNEIDDDCDGTTDLDAADGTPSYADQDGDGFGDAGSSVRLCAPLAGYVEDATDCSDGDPAAHPGAVDLCGDGIDQDCSGEDLRCTASLSINGQAATTSSPSVTLYLQEPGNLLINAGLETGTFEGWEVYDGGNGWGIRNSGLFPGHGEAIASYTACVRAQEVDLLKAGFTEEELDRAPPIRVRGWYRGNWPITEDYYGLSVELRDAGHEVKLPFSSNFDAIAGSDWKMEGTTFSSYGSGVRFIYFSETGDDAEFWAGQYGTGIDGASVTLGGPFEVRLSNDGSTWSDWTPFLPSMSWQLEPGAGLKQVYVQFKDSSGVRDVERASATITLE